MTKSKNVNLNFKKTIQISDALKANDVSMIKQLGRSPGGFLNNDIRCKVWPKLLLSSTTVEKATHVSERSNFGAKEDEDDMFPEQSEKNRNQAHGVTTEPDVYKCAMMDPNMRDSTTTTTAAAVTRKDSGPKYQGCLDDITPVFDLLFGEGSSYLMTMVRQKYTKVKKEVTQQMALIDNLIQHRQPAANNKHMTQLFSEHCVRSAMRWFIDMENIANTLRLFDLFLSYDHPWMPFYFAAALAMAQHTPRDIISTQELETLINKAIELEHGHNTVVDHSRIDISRVLYDPTLMVVASMALLAMVPSGMSTLSDLSSKVFSSFFI